MKGGGQKSTLSAEARNAEELTNAVRHRTTVRIYDLWEKFSEGQAIFVSLTAANSTAAIRVAAPAHIRAFCHQRRMLTSFSMTVSMVWTFCSSL